MKQKRKEPLTVDYHGLTVPEALLRFVSDYTKIQAGTDRGQLRLVHGYGSTGIGGKLKRALRTVLDVQQLKGALSYRSSESFDSHAGYTVVNVKKSLQPIPLGLLSEYLPSDRERTLVGSLNQEIGKAGSMDKTMVQTHLATLDPATIDLLEQVPIPSPVVEPVSKLSSFADLYKAAPKRDVRRSSDSSG